MTTGKSEALSIITAQIELYTRLRSGMETILGNVQQKSRKSLDKLLRDPSVLLIMESIIHCNEHLDKWKRLLEDETKIIAQAIKEEEDKAAQLQEESLAEGEEEEVAVAIIAAITARM